ncbi:MAG: hypothetical protein H5T64_09760 [Chloroflexi bacterium]|nr:hypothetical protein [Chloroflexota bacterium]
MTPAFLSPALVLSIVIATAYAALFHLLWGKRAQELPIYWLGALLGFGLGQLVGRLLNPRLLHLGDVYFLEGSALCWLFLLLVKWLKR